MQLAEDTNMDMLRAYSLVEKDNGMELSPRNLNSHRSSDEGQICELLGHDERLRTQGSD